VFESTLNSIGKLIQTNETVFWWLTVTSIAAFFATLIIVPWFVIRIPSDYFSDSNIERRRMPWPNWHPLVRRILLGGRNVLGYVFIVVGGAMLVLPGPGILTIVVGIMLLNFPGKYRFERWMIKRRPVMRSINWLRRLAKKAPIVLDELTIPEEPGQPVTGKNAA
jgi:hypothetical protein